MLATAACENAYVKPIAAATQDQSDYVVAEKRIITLSGLTKESDGTTRPGEDTHGTLVVAGDRSRGGSVFRLRPCITPIDPSVPSDCPPHPRSTCQTSPCTHFSKAFCTELTSNPTPAEVTATLAPTASDG